MPSGWSVIGELIGSNGEFSLEVFRLKSPIKLASVIVNEHSFNDLFARGFLENLTLLHAVQRENLHSLNVSISQGAKNLRRKMRVASKQQRVKK